MLWITCPTCGSRPFEEFRYGGEFPGWPARLTDANDQIVDYTWMLDNFDGPSTERWFHEAGCRRWHTAKRNTRTDEFLSLD
jgi:sarcosine oxidase, subunit delta